MKIVIFTHSSYSHVSSIEKIVKLLAKDNTIYCYLEKEYNCMYGEHKNIVYKYYDEKIDELLKGLLPKYTNYLEKEESANIKDIVLEMKHSLEYMIEGSMFYVDNLMDTIKDIAPDYILRDSCSLFGRIIADKLNIPVYGYVSSPAITDKFIQMNLKKYLPLTLQRSLDKFTYKEIKELFAKLQDTYKEICEHNNLRPFPVNYLTCPDEKVNFCFGTHDLNYVHTDEEKIYICMKPKMFENSIVECKKNSIVVSTGTIVSFPIKLYNYIINAFKNSSTTVFISQKYFGTNVFNVTNLPQNIKISKYINQCELVNESKLLITHGGYNSVLEAIYYRTPMLVYPICNDQLFIAEKVNEINIGSNLSNQVLSGKTLSLIASQVMGSQEILSNLDRLKNNINNINNERILDYFV